jgi:hypothetical protein
MKLTLESIAPSERPVRIYLVDERGFINVYATNGDTTANLFQICPNGGVAKIVGQTKQLLTLGFQADEKGEIYTY